MCQCSSDTGLWEKAFPGVAMDVLGVWCTSAHSLLPGLTTTLLMQVCGWSLFICCAALCAAWFRLLGPSGNQQLGRRHRGPVSRAILWPTQSCATNQPQKDMGRNCRLPRHEHSDRPGLCCSDGNAHVTATRNCNRFPLIRRLGTRGPFRINYQTCRQGE